jgi:hypothetical protein
METGKRGDGVHPFSEGRRRDSSMVLEADDTAKSGTSIEEVEGGG